MADDQAASSGATRGNWTKLFTAFRVALDIKKLLLAAGGIVSTALGWWLFAAIFYTSARPEWANYSTPEADKETKQVAWQTFRRDRERWNLMHEMAGEVPENPDKAIRYDAGDKAGSLEEFLLLEDLRPNVKTPDDLKKTLDELKDKVAKGDATAANALTTYLTHLKNPEIKRVGRLRSWPWTEERGENQYLLVEKLLRRNQDVPWKDKGLLNWLVTEQVPILVEPLTKFLAPIGYFFNTNAGGFRIRFYLILVILWTLATWGFFGGAICRIAAVQIARNEKIALGEAIAFAKEKCLSLFTAPLFPLVFLGVLTFLLATFGLIEGYTFWFGDIVLAGLLFPVVIVFGLIMAVVVVGLVGWPLMNPTIAAEGSDNFDALSRSYSYVFQALWHYLAYWGVALVYGAALVFFVGFMGSLVVYLGQWGLSRAPGLESLIPANDRQPAYLFYYAPRSMEWRDLLIKDSLYTVPGKAVTSSGRIVETVDFKDEYEKNLSVPNKIGAVLVGVWVGLLFLLVVGFGYSYFWTASTLIYFLMRQHVDDTEMEEVYYEESEPEPPPSTLATTAPAPPAKPNTIGLNVVEGDAMPTASPVAAPSSAPPPASSPPPETP